MQKLLPTCYFRGGVKNTVDNTAVSVPYDGNVEIPLKFRQALDAYAENHKKVIADFIEKLTVEINKDIDRYKEEIITEMITDNAVESMKGGLSASEVQHSAQITMETKEAILSIKTIEWIKELEKYAIKYKLASEILDSINICKKRIQAENADWSDINSAVEELLENIRCRVMPDSEWNEEGMKEVSVQVFKVQIQKITEKCHTENEAAADFSIEYGTDVVKKTFGSIQKISAVKTYLAEMKNENLYLDFFLKMEKEYDKTAILLIQGLIRDIAKNYIQVLDEMKAVFQSIGEYLPDRESKKIYGEYEERKSTLDKEMLGKAETLELGGSEIILFGQRTKDAINNIVKKWQRKKKVLILLPICMLIFSFLFEAIIAEEQIRSLIENAEMNDFMIKFGDIINRNIPLNAVGDFLYSIVAFVFMLFTNLKSVLIFTVVLLIIFFIAYLKFLKSWCNNQICRQCEEYLKIELSQFKNNNTLMLKIEKAVKSSVEEYEHENLTVLEHIFSKIEHGSAGNEKADANWFMDIKEQWNKIVLSLE